MNKQIEELDKILETFSELEKDKMLENRFAYIFAKAYQFVHLGVEDYRKNDAFQQPPIACDDAVLEKINEGCHQILAGRGLVPEKAFVNLDVDGFYALFRMFHFENISRESKHGFEIDEVEGILDCITFEHIMDKSVVSYYNFCEYLI